MTPLAARRILNLPDSYSEADVRQAFVAACNAAHPDAGGKGGDMAAILEARDILMGNAKTDIPCKTCQGSGYVRGRGVAVRCGKCNGSGVAK